MPSIEGKYKGRTAIVCGDAACIWTDLEALGCREDRQRGKIKQLVDTDYIVINKLGETFPGNIEHWYSNEGHILTKFVNARRNEYRKEFNGPNHTHSINNGAKWRWPLGGHGTSGLSAALVAIGLGYDSIVLCGIPLDDGPHNGEPHWRRCRFETAEVANTKNGGMPKAWKTAIDLAFDGKVTSMSGRTREWLPSSS